MSRVSKGRKGKYRESGLTLVELMIVVAILAITATIAVPALTRDRISSRFNNFVHKLASDLNVAKTSALGSKDSYQLIMESDGYTIFTVTIAAGSETTSRASDKRQAAGVEISGILANTAVPGVSYSPPSGPLGSPVALRLQSTGGLMLETAPKTFTPSSASIFLKSATGGYKARVVIYQATSHVKVYKGW